VQPGNGHGARPGMLSGQDGAGTPAVADPHHPATEQPTRRCWSPRDLGAAHVGIVDRHSENSPGAMQGNGGLVSLTCLLVAMDVCPVFLLLEHEAVAAVAAREPSPLLAAIFGVELADPVEFRFTFFNYFCHP
jgi:hypothetical protein